METIFQAFKGERESNSDTAGSASPTVGTVIKPVAEVARPVVESRRAARPEESHVSAKDVVRIVPPTQAPAANGGVRGANAKVKVCPHCDAFAGSDQPPAFLRWSYRLTGTPLHRCRACRRRYHTPKVSATSKQGPPIPGFLPPANGRSFQDLVRDMARDEREWRLSEEATRSR